MNIKAQWIWIKQDEACPYNQTIIARRRFTAGQVERATLAVTADSAYRLFINGQWINDGPGRSWPEHFQYDELDAAPYLQAGENEIVVIARFFGTGTFHQVPRHPGLLLQLDLCAGKNQTDSLITDETWEVALARAWKANTPKVSIQMEPFESYDARLGESLKFAKASVICAAEQGPWKDLTARDCALLTRQPFALRNFLGARVVRREAGQWVIPAARLLHPGLIEANHHVSTGCALATLIECPRPMRLRVESAHFELRVNGRKAAKAGFALDKGTNLLLAVAKNNFTHAEKDKQIRLRKTEGYKLVNPLDPGQPNPWCFIPLTEGAFVGNEMVWAGRPQADRDAALRRFEQAARQMLSQVKTPADFTRLLAPRALQVDPELLIQDDPHQQFMDREPLAEAQELVERPEGLMYENGAITTVAPTPKGDVELVYDLGTQNCGYFSLDLCAPAGTVVDLFAVEYIAPDGWVQHTWDNRNGLRYVCKEGRNQFVSLKRRAGRYLFLTLRNQQAPVKIRKIELIESTYPVVESGRFACSDPVLDQIWAISRQTLKLCMEDAFTDCPLYEQTLWVGDARNESLFAYSTFGAQDLARRCIRLAGESLERYPLVGCQVPSAWECILPAWSFLWGISVWDYYFYTGDKAFLRQAWKWVKRNLKQSERHLDEHGLFSGPFWNLFDWTGIDCLHETVLHNSLILIGAIDAALRCAVALGDKATATWLKAFRKRLAKASNALWQEEKQAYADGVHEDGTISPVSSQHTSFLSILYDVVERKNFDAALTNTLTPPRGMVTIGSPFAIQFAYEALEKVGRHTALLASIREQYLPMLRLGSTTVWETFAGREGLPAGAPTRSHCHAWSAAPLYFLNRIVLGIRQAEVGGTAYEISPWVAEHEWADGASAGLRGPVEVRWEKQGGTLAVTAKAPQGVRLAFRRNPSHEGLAIQFNGRTVR